VGQAEAETVAVDRLALTRHLPLTLGIAVRLRDAGADDTFIAVALDIDPEGVGPLLEVAEAKLRHLAVAGAARDVPGPGTSGYP
jgi:hypothetical protein